MHVHCCRGQKSSKGVNAPKRTDYVTIFTLDYKAKKKK